MRVTAKILVDAGADCEIKNNAGKAWYQLTSDQAFIKEVGGSFCLLFFFSLSDTSKREG